MAEILRFSNQGPVVLGLGGTYPNYASIPSVFGGPSQGIIISTYNRGGLYVPNTPYNQSVPVTIGSNNPVDFSDYYTTTNYVGIAPPPIPNPRPVNPNDPDVPNEQAVAIPQISPPQTAYIGNTVSMGSLVTKNGPAGLFTCSSVTIDGIVAPNVASDPSNIEFVVQGGMNYNPQTRSTVSINSPQLLNPIVIPNYFARFALNYSLYGSLSATSAFAGDQIQISNLLSLQTNPSPTVTIGGIQQTIDQIIPHDDIQNDILITISTSTPTTNSPIIITNAKGDSVTLPVQFRRATQSTPVNPIDRGTPPNIDWVAPDQGNDETLVFNFSSDLTVGSSTGYTFTQPGNAPPRGLRNETTSDPGGGYGNNSPYLAYDNEFSYRENLTGFNVQIGTITEDVILPPRSTSGTTSVTFSFNAGGYSYDYNGVNGIFVTIPGPGGTYIGQGTVGSISWRMVGFVTYNSSTQQNVQIVEITNSSPVEEEVIIIPAGTSIFSSIATYVSTTITLSSPVSPSITLTGGKYYVTTRNGYPVRMDGGIVVQSYKFNNLYLFATSDIRTLASRRFWWGSGYNLGNSLNIRRFESPTIQSGYTVFNREIVTVGSSYFSPFYVYRCTFNGNIYISTPFALFKVGSVTASLLLNTNAGSSAYTGFKSDNYLSPAYRFYNWGSTVVLLFPSSLYSLSTESFIWGLGISGTIEDILITNGELVLVTPGPASSFPSTTIYYVNTGSTTAVQVTGWTYGSAARIPAYVNLNQDGTYTIVAGVYAGNTFRYFVSTTGQEDTLEPTPVAYWSFYRPASSENMYEELNINIILQPNETNAQRAQSVANVLLANWGGVDSPSTQITTDAGGNTLLLFNTGSSRFSRSTLTLYEGEPSSGSFTMTTTGGSDSESTATLTRLQVGTTGQVYLDSNYGYVGNLTFTHTLDGFDENSSVIGNANQPSSIRDIIFY